MTRRYSSFPVLGTYFNNKPDSSKDFTILMISLISSFDTNNTVLLWPDLNIFLWIPASVADATAVNPKGIKIRLANGLITFFINGNPVFSNGPVIYQEILLIVSP